MTDTVKLIIEIPKEAKQAFDKAQSNDLKGGYYDHDGIIGKAIRNGTPLDFMFVFTNYCGHCKCYMPFEESEET